MASGVPDHHFQVGTSFGHKWKADVKPELNQKINLSMSVGQNEDNWSFEREKDEPLWSFYIFSDAGKKLYLSYDEHNDDITLEFKNDSDHGKKRFFTILVQTNDQYLFRAYHREDRYIGRTGENGYLKLEKFTTETTLWLIKKDFTLVVSSQSQSFSTSMWSTLNGVEIQAKTESKKWISSGAQARQQIKVQQSSTERWKLSRTWEGEQEIWTFSPWDNPALSPSSATIQRGVEYAIVFQDRRLNSNAQVGSFRVEGKGLAILTSHKFQNKDSDWWLAVDKSHLSQVKEEKHAVAWETLTHNLSYEWCNEIYFFPLY